ncbi:MAG: polyribonucleotide nucleotidyltransferase [Acidobacteria bacterium]|uniref:Polyribonucleotide nucleotidyltransferase n=1 Tax=Candidatus Sulfomarinibacter kjeldsenii TaxID=2885994 RepID=A0A8J7C307_9BACT|nr:polyribonucleotide nucleotidyltransferase [Candidatus Sulfomarinibacter kjeldsenii]MBD3857144.1 polyribonucleotide nucleotidyltransferase [Candidatus Sulfomarinibacter kjeldsenii]MBD3869870.1 polyribonucleotide nucleotidyltransferase [Candidatus Sulfomarinibacter kjeldsenii]
MRKTVEIDGKTLSFETGKIAKQADGSVVVSMGDTMVLVTACSEESQRQGVDFLPLTVDYRENTYASGRIPGGFFKREGRPTEREILTCRVIDRGLRPLFPDGYHRETQVIAWVLSADGVYNSDIYGISGASMALLMSAKIPFTEAIAGVRIGRIDGKFVIFPTFEELKESELDLVVAGTNDALAMVECGATELSESVILDALDLAHQEVKRIIALQHEIVAELGVVKEEFVADPIPWSDDFVEALRGRWTDELREALKVRGKFEQKDAIKAVREKALAELSEEEADEKTPWVKNVFGSMVKAITRETILDQRERLDGRAFDEIRSVTCEAGVLPRTHGSALFTRGETQAIVTCTLGTSDDTQLIESVEGDWRETFMLHYNFPPFSVGEARFLRGPGRREIGHGALARRALKPMIPSADEFPYTLRVVSDILESNGSSSMASVCGGSMSMMDAGVPLKSPVAGIAMGLVAEGDRYGVLTDIAGQEDHYGDMDFKVAGTAKGITALQMDIKVEGLSRQILEEAMEQARVGRLQLLDSMSQAISEGREDISQYAPRIIQIKIDVDKIRNVIGPGGKMIRHIVETTGAKINVEDDGTVQIATSDGEAAKKAIEMVQGLTRVPEIGEEFDGIVRRIEPYGAFVEILPNHDGLVHISELSLERIPDIRDVLTEGDELKVRIIDIDANDRIKLSRRVILEDEARERGEDIPERDSRPPRDNRRGGRPGGGRGGGRDRGPRRN